MSTKEELRRANLAGATSAVGRLVEADLAQKMGRRVGYLVLTFDFGVSDGVAYASNVQPREIAQALRRAAKQFEKMPSKSGG